MIESTERGNGPMGMSINGVGTAMNPAVQRSHNNTNAPKLDDIKSSLIDADKEVAHVEQMRQEAMSSTREETKKQQMDINTRSQSMMGFGNKFQMQFQ